VAFWLNPTAVQQIQEDKDNEWFNGIFHAVTEAFYGSMERRAMPALNRRSVRPRCRCDGATWGFGKEGACKPAARDRALKTPGQLLA
jgi:hypothetical protein